MVKEFPLVKLFFNVYHVVTYFLRVISYFPCGCQSKL